MYYEVYVDVLFVENLWVNVCLLLLTSRLMGYQTDRKRIAAGAALGSMGACLLETGSADNSRMVSGDDSYGGSYDPDRIRKKEHIHKVSGHVISGRMAA